MGIVFGGASGIGCFSLACGVGELLTIIISSICSESS